VATARKRLHREQDRLHPQDHSPPPVASIAVRQQVFAGPLFAP
jgi:hypothetical protein